MMKLIFFTSNRAKLAHARHWAEEIDVDIIGFRQKTYLADYIEPRLDSRDEILKESYENALKQCEKAGINTETTAFFLEDTSVKIYALSSEEKDVPGVNIKFWMQDTNFSQLDILLKDHGNDRRAEVRSDVLLHIPQHYKKIYELTSKFKVFTSKQGGTIVDDEIEFDTNLVYPWLDNRTFNRWFQPYRTDKPLGSLEIELANIVDFRRDSFRKAYSFLLPIPRENKSRKQFELLFDSRPNIILCGYTCSGKTTASQYLASAYDYQHVEASDFMQMSCFRRHGIDSDIAVSDFAEVALKKKPLIVAQQVLEYIEEDRATPVVISGFRSILEVDHLVRSMQYSSRNFIVVFLHADFEERFRRLKRRMRYGDAGSIEEFGGKDIQQKAMGLDDIRKNSSTISWHNTGSLDEYYRFLDTQMPRGAGSDSDVVSIKLEFCNQQDVKLEDAILITLLNEWSTVEIDRQYYSTTEIAAKINVLFSNIQPKHKDNVSRYFNQDFHSYFEVIALPQDGANKYRLSNTGHSRALRTLRKFKIAEESEYN